MEENTSSHGLQIPLDHASCAAADPNTDRPIVQSHVSIDIDIPVNTSNEGAPQPQTLDPSNVGSPILPGGVVTNPVKTDKEMDTNVSTRPVPPEIYPPPSDSTTGQQLPSILVYNRKGISKDLEDRFPVIVAHSPKHQALWDRLPFGTLYTVARVASNLRIDLEYLETSHLVPLIGRNITMEQVEGVLRRARGEDLVQEGIPNKSYDRHLKNIINELDWEAEQIVAGTGEMLGWREEKGTRYGGKVQFAATLRLYEKPSTNGNWFASNSGPLDLDNFGHITLEAPSIRGSSLFTRTFGSHHFLRVNVSKEIKAQYSLSRRGGDACRIAQKVMKEWSQRPIFILGRVYSFFREICDVNFYFLEGSERLGEAFDNGRRGYGLTECTSVEQLIDWWSPLRHNGVQDWSAFCTQLELGLSDTLPGMFIAPEDIEVVPDIG